MIDFNDLQKPLVAALVLGAAATAGFAAGYVVGRDPETARSIARTTAGGLARIRIAMAEAMESLGDLWAEARDEAHREIEVERSAAEAPVAAGKAAVAAAAVAAASRAPRKKKTVRRPQAKAARRGPKRRTVSAA